MQCDFFVLLTPMEGFCSESVRAFLQEHRSEMIPLSLFLMKNPDGRFEAIRSIVPIFSRFEESVGGLNKSGTVEGFSTGQILTQGRLRYSDGFEDVWLGDAYCNLRKRTQARLCIEYLVKNVAFDVKSARHFIDEIDPYVRERGGYPPAAEIRIYHYFTDRTGKLQKLRKALIGSAGRNGKYFLKIK